MLARTLIALLLSSALLTAAAPSPSAAFIHAKALADQGKSAEARTAFEALTHDPSATASDQALALMELSRIDLAAGHYPASIASGKQAATSLHNLHDSVNEGSALTITGLARMYSGDYNNALTNFETALALARQTGDLRQQVTRLNNIGNVRYFQGRYADSLDTLNLALQIVNAHPTEPWSLGRRQLTVANIAIIYQTLGQYDRALDTYSSLQSASAELIPQEHAQLLANIGALYRRRGDPIKALENYRSARELYSTHQLRRGEISVLNNIGIAQALDLQQFAQALAAFNSALTLATSSGDQLAALQSLLYRAETFYRMHRLPESRADFEKASTLATSLHAPEEKWKAEHGLARLALLGGDSATCIALLRDAVQQIESLRGATPTSLRSDFLADKRQVYDLLISQLAKDPAAQPSTLFDLIEHSRARTVQDRKTNPPSLLESSRRLPPGTLLLEYWLGSDSLVVVWATSASNGARLVSDQTGLRAKLRDFSESLSDPNNSTWQQQASPIAASLLGAISEPLSSAAVTSLVIVPDREISLIPFDVLPLSGARLLDRFTISSIPSAALLQPSSEATQRRPIFPFWKRTLLALGDPAPHAAPSSFAMPSARDARRLPAAALEVRAAAALTGGHTASYLGAAATRANLRFGLAQHFPLLHLATHAFSDPEDAARSYILLAGDTPTNAWDYLFLNEVRGLDLHGVDLVTISACETETGKLVEGEGVASFSRAFLAAGARTVVTSLWPVGDRPTAALMKKFYANLAEGMPTAEALRAAKKDFATGRQSHPFYWAAFVANGDPGVRTPFVISWMYLLAALLALVGAGLLLRHRFSGR